MNNPKVSVIIPVYNVEKYLQRCITSVVEQTYKNLEIILVDDGSTDGCSSICDSWSEKDTRIITVHKQNAGLGMARNTGLDNATGQYVLFVDSDDYIDTRTVEKCVANSIENHSSVVMFGRYNVFSDGTLEKKLIPSGKLLFENNEVIDDLLTGLFNYRWGMGISAWGKMFDLTLFKTYNIRFRSEREVLAEDAFFALEFFSHIKCVSILPENLYYYYQNQNSLSRKYEKGYQSRIDVFLSKSMELCKELEYPITVSCHVKARYLMFAIAGMKRIVVSSLSAKEKDKELRDVFDNRLLRDTLTNDVLRLDNLSSRIFWKLFKLRMYHICRFLLWYKANR